MRARVHDILEMSDPKDPLCRAFSIFIVSLILINVVCIVLESMEELERQYRELFLFIEISSTLVFATEYLMRLWSCVESNQKIGANASNSKKRLKYVLSPMAIIDLVAFLPSLLQVLFPGIDLRFLRILRLLRVFKLTRYFSTFELLFNVLHEERKNLAGIFVILIVILVMAASALYLVERDVQPDKFGSIPEAMWWAIAALTTVGYGDVYPITLLGKICASFIALIGIGVVALPAGIIAANFTKELSNDKK